MTITPSPCHVTRLPDHTIKKWAVKCKDDELVIVLKDCSNYLTNKISSNMEPGKAKKIKREIEEQDLVSLDRAFEAMGNLIDILRQMEAHGEIIIERFEY